MSDIRYAADPLVDLLNLVLTSDPSQTLIQQLQWFDNTCKPEDKILDGALRSVGGETIPSMTGLDPDVFSVTNDDPFSAMISFIQHSDRDNESPIVVITSDRDLGFPGSPFVDPALFMLKRNAEASAFTSEKCRDRAGGACCNCGTRETTLWRRVEGRLMCNPCALYFKLHGHARPLHLLNSSIKRRKRRSNKN